MAKRPYATHFETLNLDRPEDGRGFATVGFGGLLKRFALLTLGAALTLPGPAVSQDMPAAVREALAALPARAREEATVIRWNVDNTYQTLKKGTNAMVCYDRSGEARRAPFDVQCTSLRNLDRVKQNREFRATAADRAAESAMVAAADANGTRAEVEYGSVWIAMRGDDQASARKHTTIAVPGATTASTGFPENGRSGGVYIMGAGTAAAHLMTPGN